MISTIQSPYTSQQLSVWLRGLLTVAWADGHFDVEEQTLITALTDQPLLSTAPLEVFQPISLTELAAALVHDSSAAENFLRTAVMVAIVDGVYSSSEDELLLQYCQALNLNAEILQVLRTSLNEPFIQAQTAEPWSAHSNQPTQSHTHLELHHAMLQPVQSWLDKLEIHDPKVAHFLCKIIPSHCPFERDINLFGRKVAHVPPLCKLNPLYEQLVGLRFRALSYLADSCGEDVSSYC